MGGIYRSASAVIVLDFAAESVSFDSPGDLVGEKPDIHIT